MEVEFRRRWIGAFFSRQFEGLRTRVSHPIRVRMHQLRTRVLVFSVATALFLGIASFYTQLNAQLFMRSMVHIFQRNSVFVEVDRKVKTIDRLLETYLSTKSSEAIKEYWTQNQALYELIRGVDQRPYADRASLLRKDIATLTAAYLKSTEIAQNAKRGRDVSAYTAAFAESERLSAYIDEAIDELTIDDYTASIAQGQLFFDQLSLIQLFNVLMLAALIALAIVLGFWFSYKLTDPLSRLAEAADEISRGNYERAVVEYPRRDEIGVLTAAFESMRRGIISNIRDLQEKAEIETGLMEERVKNLRMKNLLKNAELAALQAQINPHFLFNTLNAGIQLAVVEDAEQTRTYMEHLADLLRHNMRKLDRAVSIGEELSSLRSYLYIVRIRFADRFELSVRTPDQFPDLQVPAMILQPLVENSLMHGLKDRESGGWVRVELREEDSDLVISVADNGDGIRPEVIQRVLAIDGERHDQDNRGEHGGQEREKTTETETRDTHHHDHGDPTSAHSGIGLGNVVARLKLFFNREDSVSIESGLGTGTTISIRIPRETSDYV